MNLRTSLLIAVLLAGHLFGAEAPVPKRAPITRAEVFLSKIIRIYSATDGERRYVSYVVQWHDSEIIVTPGTHAHGAGALRVGDTVRCVVRHDLRTMSDGIPLPIIFSLLGRPEDPSTPTEATIEDETRRLEAVAAEVARRRQIREEAAKAINDKRP